MTYFALSISFFPSHATLRRTPIWPLVPSLCSIFNRSAKPLVPFHAYSDFPESVDARTNPNAFALLQRDLQNVCRYFERHGIQSGPDLLAHQLWDWYLYGAQAG